MTTKTKGIFTLLSLALFILTLACTNKKSTNNTLSTEDIIMNNQSNELFLFAGTYTSKQGSEGIYLYKMNIESGKIDSISMIEADNPSYLVLSRDEKNLYAVGESGENSTVSAFAFDKNKGTISHLNTQPSGGADPCYIEIDKSGNNILTANYSSGSISLFSVRDDGSISSVNSVFQFDGSGPDSSRQATSHLHSVRFSPDDRYLFATDLGADKIYRFNSTGSVFEGQPSINKQDMIHIDAPKGMGPRHFDFHPSGNYLYLLGELSGTISVYDYNDGSISEKQSVISDSLSARGSADIHVSPNGKFLYASNRLSGDGITIFSIDENNGELTKVAYQPTGIHPRNFIITPNGEFLLVACRDDNKIQVFAIDENSGILTDTNNDISISNPVCLKFASIY